MSREDSFFQTFESSIIRSYFLIENVEQKFMANLALKQKQKNDRLFHLVESTLFCILQKNIFMNLKCFGLQKN